MTDCCCMHGCNNPLSVFDAEVVHLLQRHLWMLMTAIQTSLRRKRYLLCSWLLLIRQ